MLRTAHDIRRSYLDFFKARDHVERPSAPLAPEDPTLLFSVAGMVQFKPYYSMPPDQLPFRRATTVQKCLRANDLESVGRTLRHHTFFEMLGNFSFGDYFKAEAIEWAWEYTTRTLQLDPQRLWISVYLDDDEAATLWRKVSGLPEARIVRLGKEDNFWGPAGDTGACGPSSELYFDTGEAHACGRASCAVGCDCDRYIEFWNLVFPQFDMQPDGTLAPLEHPGIDTGMGLERTTFLVEGVPDNFRTDLFRPILERMQELLDLEYERDETTRLAMNAVADHVRALTFALSENIYPSNEGRGYVIRRILRRASGKLRTLGRVEPFLYRLVDTVVEVMAPAYPELRQAAPRVTALIEAEEQRFVNTLEAGMARFEEAVGRAQGTGGVVRGEDVFTLYDTFGFPPELTEEMAGDRGLQVDLEGFQRAMEAQRERARARARFKAIPASGAGFPELQLAAPGPSTFVGYDRMREEAVLQRLVWRRGEREAAAARDDAPLAGERFDLVVDRTPFYATSGGQVADQGVWTTEDFIWKVVDVRKEDDTIVHTALLVEHPSAIDSWEALADALQARQPLRLLGAVEEEVRRDTMRNHTATHLLHAALKRVLGEHVQQAGSLVAPDRLRFDFNHFAALTTEEIEAIESEVNDVVLRNLEVTKEVQEYAAAIAAGAVAMFGEKYGDRVRVVRVGSYSQELCGGTHVDRTGDIGLFVLTTEGSVAAGVRRVEALTGRGARAYVAALRRTAQATSRVLGLGRGQDPVQRIQELQDESRQLRRALEAAQAQLAGSLAHDLVAAAAAVDGVRVVAARVEVPDGEALRELADAVRRDLDSGVAVLAAEIGDKILFVATVTEDLVRRGVQAGRLVGQVARITGGGGGGKPHLAQAGGRDRSKLQEALDQVIPMVKEAL